MQRPHSESRPPNSSPPALAKQFERSFRLEAAVLNAKALTWTIRQIAPDLGAGEAAGAVLVLAEQLTAVLDAGLLPIEG